MNERELRRPFSRDTVKWIATFCMLLDHIGWYFLPFATPTAQVFHVLGRITAPVMCCFLARGARYTHNPRRYLLRLLIFAVLAQIPWYFLHSSKDSFNMLFTLFFCLLMLLLCNAELPLFLRLPGAALCIAATYFCDWGIHAPLWCLIFFYLRGSRVKEVVAFSAVALEYFGELVIKRMALSYTPRDAVFTSLFALGVFLALPLLAMTDEPKREANRSAFSKWFFYVFYPLHLGVIALIKLAMK